MPPDLATCDDCLSELREPGNARHGYSFTNCVNCGPRFTIVRELPYDRDRTSMASFEMCEKCGSEYVDPGDRRFDAQPNACPVCGPQIRLIDEYCNVVDGEPVSRAGELIKSGAILAVKGLGGYHVCCDASNDGVVSLLRSRKNRPFKAFAVMFGTLDEVEQCCVLDEDERAELLSPARPIVVLDRRAGCSLSKLVSLDTNDVGAFLAYTPLHHLLLSETGPLVMTSGNLVDEPIAKDEHELKEILGKVADYAIVHNREIVRRCDDSVMKVRQGRRQFLRRSRGYVPEGIRLPVEGPSVIGCGAELKNVFCVTRGMTAICSQHIGDLADYRAYRFFVEAVDDMVRLLEIEPEIVAHDLHPDYMSTRYALHVPVDRKVAVQHHHAHIAACMAEHGLTEQVIGVAFDGAGLGDDGTVWGGEFLVADLSEYRRAMFLKRYRLPGGDAATLYPDRMALSYLMTDLDADVGETGRILPGMDETRRVALARMIDNGIHSPWTSSAGRLFDAVSAMLGLCTSISYEGQAAIRLQAAATRDVGEAYGFDIDGQAVDFGPMIREIVGDIEGGVGKASIAGKFHFTLACAASSACEMIRAQTRIRKVVLSGGVFQNDFLLQLLCDRLEAAGFEVYSHFLMPPNDACVGLGQAAVALAREGGRTCHAEGVMKAKVGELNRRKQRKRRGENPNREIR
jgi:hydrogenase maturation protein HypF